MSSFDSQQVTLLFLPCMQEIEGQGRVWGTGGQPDGQLASVTIRTKDSHFSDASSTERIKRLRSRYSQKETEGLLASWLHFVKKRKIPIFLLKQLNDHIAEMSSVEERSLRN